MTTFKEFRDVVRLGMKDKVSGKRMREMRRILHRTGVLRHPTPKRASEAAELLGPTYVKIAQVASNRSDLLPKEYCEEFSRLRARVAPMTFEQIEECIRNSYGHPWQDVFAELDPTPLGSASIAQVHKAKLKDGTTVAVKVQRPGIVDTMHADIMLMRRVLATAEFMTPATPILGSAGGLVEELADTTEKELNFNVEQENLLRFYESMQKQAGVTSPMPYPQFSTREILVMEYVEGIPINDKVGAALKGYDQAALGQRLAESYITQIIDDGFFHADPHPGNIQIRDGELVWIDLGMTGSLSASERTLVGKVFMAIAANNPLELKNSLLSLCVVSGDLDHGRLLQDVEMLLARYGNTNLEELNVGQAFIDLMELLREHSIGLPSALTMLGRGLLTLEGVVGEIAPKTNITEIIANHMQMHMIDLESAREKTKEMIMATLASAEAAARFPYQLGNTLDMAQKGQLKLNMSASVPDEMLGHLYTMVGRVSLSLIASALFLGSAMMTQVQFLAAKTLSVFGFIGAGILSGYVILSIVRTRHQIRNKLDIK